MFINVNMQCDIMDDYIKYVTEARITRVSDKQYEAVMESLLDKCLKELKRTSTNKRLIAKYENKINQLFDRTA